MLGAVISTTSLVARPPLTFICSGASPEWKLNMAMLLQAIYEQDENLTLVAGGVDRVSEHKRLAEQARQYVASDEFTEMCNLVGVDASFLRALAPNKARIAYSRLMDNKLSGLDKEEN
jgi:uncharacterized metal-binding protein